ncbi:MAG: zinc-ribbon domain-containing protein, partial [Clostridia bacterium]|nr:zinc-ribbon domain-containing protein [Clostridia bacterium]
MYCPNCGKKLNEDEKFCSGCGKKVGTVNSLVPKDKAKLPVVMDVTTRKEKSKKPVGLIAFCCVLVVALLVCGGVILKDVLFPSYTTVPQSESVSSTVTTPKPTPTLEIDEDEVRYQEIINECKELKAKGEYIKILKKLERLSSSDSRYQKKYEQYEAEMIESVLSKAEEFAKEDDYENAIKTITSMQADYPCNEFTDAIETYKNCLPVLLHKMSVFKMDTVGGSLQSRTDEVDSYKMDNYGNEYEHSVSVGKGYITFL